MTAFADYICLLPCASWESPATPRNGARHQLLPVDPRDSRWEIEIRAHCIYATALLREEVNKLRAPDAQVIIRKSMRALDALPHHHLASPPY